MQRAVEMKLYLTDAQQATLTSWLEECCRFYNRCLEQRIKAYRRRRESMTYSGQCAFLTDLRYRIPSLKAVPVEFVRDAIRRLDRGFDAFFRRLKTGQKPGFPRFRASSRYNSMECLQAGCYIRPGNLLRIPKLGLISFRAGNQQLNGKQKLIRIIRRASGWFAQVWIDDGIGAPPKIAVVSAVGIDVGLTAFATLSTGEKIDNPRFLRRSERRLKRAQRRVSRCHRHSRNRRKAVSRLALAHERIAAQRKDFAHQESRRLVDRFDLIGFEKLNVRGLARTCLAKSINDAAWSMFTRFVTYKAEEAGKHAVAVDPRGTSQECPWCGELKPKSLFERIHRCDCKPGVVIDRDHASGLVIESRALGVAGAYCGGIGLCAANASGVSQPDETESQNGVEHR